VERRLADPISQRAVTVTMTEDELHTVWAAMRAGSEPPAAIVELLARLRKLKQKGRDPFADLFADAMTRELLVGAMIDDYLAGQKADR
jgi:hypothetical protein